MDHRLTLSSTFFKAHGVGNDYLVFEEGPGWAVSSETLELLCHPHRGVGADGVVAVLGDEAAMNTGGDGRVSPGLSSFSLRMFNPDGSEFERSGNGLRILGSYLYSVGRVGLGKPFLVRVGGGQVELEILGQGPRGAVDVRVEMGKARFGVHAVQGDPDAFGTGGTLDSPGGSPLPVELVSMGNPHCVVFTDDLREEALVELGPFLASHRAFPRGTNVQLARVSDAREVEILIWERGVGRTASSGTSACAVAAAGVHAGLLRPGRVRVRMEGGSLSVTVSEEMEIRLEGPVQPLFVGVLAPALLDFLGSLSTLDP